MANPVAAMGRVWYLEATACQRMKAHDRLVDSVRKVCRAAKATGYWRERSRWCCLCRAEFTQKNPRHEVCGKCARELLGKSGEELAELCRVELEGF